MNSGLMGWDSVYTGLEEILNTLRYDSYRLEKIPSSRSKLRHVCCILRAKVFPCFPKVFAHCPSNSHLPTLRNFCLKLVPSHVQFSRGKDQIFDEKCPFSSGKRLVFEV